ncbi:hypothetical protein AM501_09500 [Aneurinibacillus migulanus]|uniref:DUF2726 domain-containing protein n=1 Tax=Aneurinibacillus migulanus TaxID=47500 RepID=UPI0005BCBCF6|nr:DUF2726 domain-containing protein [Aneurinibacillus migulanus]KIV58963.1 hypothetical protein TS64_04160 [Aneurinibacillus migulanus]KPD08515.1 hypothetical protein AM501_09500 [Aneurinibacillus migulanus]
MLKKLQNEPEKLTSDQIEEICKKYGAKVYPKIRVADVFEITGSGISNELYSYALKAHFDTIVYDMHSNPIFAVEFDGNRHISDPVQIERDLKKNKLCERFGLPLLRITSDFLHERYRGINLLSWFIEVWFMSQCFYQAKEEGNFSYDEPFMPMSLYGISGSDREFPLWLSKSAREKIATLRERGLIENSMPATVVWVDQNRNYHCLAWVVIENNTVAFSKNKMRGQQFPAPIHDLIEDITVIDLTEKLINILKGKNTGQTINQLNEEIIKHRTKYRLVLGGGESHEKIENWFHTP